jgi:hypothetical protein
MFEESFIGPPPLTTTARITLTVWVAILVPWVPFFTLMGTGMAFEGGYTIGAYLAVFQFWAYPILVGVSYYFRRRKPVLVWLPALVLVPALI